MRERDMYIHEFGRSPVPDEPGAERIGAEPLGSTIAARLRSGDQAETMAIVDASHGTAADHRRISDAIRRLSEARNIFVLALTDYEQAIRALDRARCPMVESNDGG